MQFSIIYCFICNVAGEEGKAGAGAPLARRRAVVGTLWRRLLDLGRVAWLRERGWTSAHLVRYIDARTSAENVLLVCGALR